MEPWLNQEPSDEQHLAIGVLKGVLMECVCQEFGAVCDLAPDLLFFCCIKVARLIGSVRATVQSTVSVDLPRANPKITKTQTCMDF